VIHDDASRWRADLRRNFTLLILLLTVAGLPAVAGCKRDPAGSATAETGADGATRSDGPKHIDLEKPVIKIETSVGDISVQLDAIKAPGTVRNFLNYASDRFYDNSLVHFVDPGKMIVAGGYSAERKPKSPGTPIRNEAHNGLKNARGTIAMTRDPAQIDSATSQFFINLADAPQRDHTGDAADTYGYCVFGEVIEGLDVADKISQATISDQGSDLAQTPNPPVVIKSVRVVR
jgi:peptidyl-prolyl cis-trans isomerase A (cyclophilin A)